MTEDFATKREEISSELSAKTAEIASFNNRLEVVRNQLKTLENNALSHDADSFADLRLDSFKLEQKIEFLSLQKRELQSQLNRVSVNEAIASYKSHLPEIKRRARRLDDLVDLCLELIESFSTEPVITGRKNMHSPGGPAIDALISFPDDLLAQLKPLSHLKINESDTRINIDW